MIENFGNFFNGLTRRLITESATGSFSTNDILSEQPARIRRQRIQAVFIAGGSLIGLYVLATLLSHLPGLVERHDHRRCYLMFAGILVTLCGVALAKRERPMEGMWVICFGILVVYAILQVASQAGIRSPASHVLMLLIPLAGFVGGKRNMQPVFAGVLLALTASYLAERTGFLRGMSGTNLSLLEAVFIIQMSVAIGLYMLSRVVGDSLDLLANLPHESNRVISHELRQPLSTVVAAVQVLSHPHLSDAMKQRTIKSLSNATNTMMGLLDDIADHGKLASGVAELTLAPFSPISVTQEVFGMYEGAATQKGVTPRLRVDIDEKTVLMGDASRITQILSNLMSNAVKFTEHGEIALTISGKPLAQDPDLVSVRFTVMDTGLGIPKDRQRQIFQAFAKGHEDKFNHPGMGLGLSIARHLTDAMNGQIGFESTRGRGSIFWVEVRLPLAGSASAQASEGVIPLPLNKNRLGA